MDRMVALAAAKLKEQVLFPLYFCRVIYMFERKIQCEEIGKLG